MQDNSEAAQLRWWWVIALLFPVFIILILNCVMIFHTNDNVTQLRQTMDDAENLIKVDYETRLRELHEGLDALQRALHPREFAYHATIFNNGQVECDGALVSTKHVLTAWSCVNQPDTNLSTIRIQLEALDEKFAVRQILNDRFGQLALIEIEGSLQEYKEKQPVDLEQVLPADKKGLCIIGRKWNNNTKNPVEEIETNPYSNEEILLNSNEPFDFCLGKVGSPVVICKEKRIVGIVRAVVKHGKSNAGYDVVSIGQNYNDILNFITNSWQTRNEFSEL